MTYKQARAELKKQLGGKCVVCGTTKQLQFDHVTPRKWHPENISKEKRLRTYKRAQKKSKIQLLCRDCHTAKTGREGGKTPWLGKVLDAIFNDPEPF